MATQAIGIDLGKTVFHLVALDERGAVSNRRRTRVVGAFPDGRSALMLVAARLRHVAGTKWGSRRYLDMARLKEVSAA